MLDLEQPVLFDVVEHKQINIENALFPNPYELSDLVWRKDSQSFTFEYNQRGHQVYRVIEVNGSGKARTVISVLAHQLLQLSQCEWQSCRFGRRYRFDVNDGKEVIWMSERDAGGVAIFTMALPAPVKDQITRGEFVVRAVQRVDESKRQIWFSSGGTHEGKDPYFASYFRINFDGSGLTELTTVDANHNVSYSTDSQFYVDNYSRSIFLQ